MKEDLLSQIMKIISEWTPEIQALADRKDIVAINFGAQKAFDGYEFYLSGHTWFDGHDLWLLEGSWSPSENFVSIGPDSLNYDRIYVLENLEKVIQDKLAQPVSTYGKLIVTVGLVDSNYKRLK